MIKLYEKFNRILFLAILVLFFSNLANKSYSYNLSSNEVSNLIYQNINLEAKENLKQYSDDIKIELSNIPFRTFETNENNKPIIEINSNYQNEDFRLNSIKKINIKSSDNRILKTFIVSYKIFVYKDVLVSNSLIQYNGEINKNNTHLEKREISRHLGKTISNLEDNLISKRNYPKGAIILKDYLQDKNSVLRNSLVNIIFQSDKGLQIKIQGRALKDGCIGDNILVRSDKYNKTYNAKILSSKDVKVRI